MEGGTGQHQPADISITEPSRIKKYLPLIVLLVILIFGGYLRVYHLDYPVVGYHNWKETHYLTEARNFARDGFFEHGVFVPAWDLPFIAEDPDGAHADTFPTISLLGAVGFKIFGENLWVARGIGVLLNLASILFIYLIVKMLFKREDLALTTAFLAALNPLMVFFSRNFQLTSPALLLMLAGLYFLFLYIEKDKAKFLLLATAFTVWGIMTKYSFVVMAFPWLVVFPYKRLLDWKKRKGQIFGSAGIIAVLAIWYWYMEYYFKGMIREVYGVTGGAAIRLTEIISFKEIFAASFYQAMRSFIADNFTIIGFWFAIAGFVLLVLMRKKYPLGGKFFLSYAVFGVLFSVILAHKLGGHSYHQFPYAFLVVFLIAFAFIVIGATIGKLVKVPHVKWVAIVLLMALLWVPSMQALDRQFGTQFPGHDAAGDLIKAESGPDERIFHSSHQSYGILWHADRKGYKLPGDLVSFKKGEEQGASWIFVYQWRFNFFQEEAMSYVRENYQLRQVGFVMQGTQFTPYYFLLQKGGTFDDANLQQYLSGQPLSTRNYELPGGILSLNVITLPRQVEIPEPMFEFNQTSNSS